MKLFFSIPSFFVLIFLIHYEKKKETPKLLCILTSDKALYKRGELPKLQIRIKNTSDESIYLIGSLEKSDKSRFPHCFYSIEKPMPDTIKPPSICGFSNPLRLDDFVLITPNETFNPYQPIDNYGFWPDYITAQKETFRNPGCYKIQFHYSTASFDIQNYIGSKQLDKVKDAPLIALLNKVPKVELTSNIIYISIQE